MRKIREVDTYTRIKKENLSEVQISVVLLRVTECEDMKFKEKAEETGCRTISQYIRLKCLVDESVNNVTEKR